MTYEDVRKFLKYDSNTGYFTWQLRPSNRVNIGDIAGCANKRTGYITIRLKSKLYQAHRLAWLITHGEWPAEIDHINHIRTDNRLENLRAATRKENCRNNAQSLNNTSGVCGVYWSKSRRKWTSQIMVNRKVIYLGRYDSIEDAAKKRKMAEVLYGFHPNHGGA